MRQELFDCDGVAALALHFGDKFDERIAEANFTTFDQNHDAGCSGHHFRQTREIENRVRRHCFSLRLHGARAIRLAPNDPIMVTDEHYRARKLFFLDRLRDDSIHSREALSRDADSRGRLSADLCRSYRRNQNDDCKERP